MSKQKKKRVVTTGNKKEPSNRPATPRGRSAATTTTPSRAFTFGRDNYIWMGIGALLVVAGMMLMSGGSMPSPDVWEEDIIYSTRRTVLAPIVILAGLAVEVYAIFK
ncbi:MAG: DUF3098 domain-containing protein [Bacteroidota bacterium]